MLHAATWIHWLHLCAAAVWVGAAVTASLALRPALNAALEPAAGLAVYRELAPRLARLQWGTWSVLAATGAWKLWALRGSPSAFAAPFALFLGAKLALIAAMVSIALAHAWAWGPRLLALAPEDPAAPALARRMAFWGKVNAGLLLAILFCASLLVWGD